MKTAEMSVKNKSQQLAAARAALAESGKSSRQIGRESKLKIADWIYRWGYSSSSLVQDLLGKTSGGYAQKLVKQGWLKATKTESGAPAVFYTLSELGLQEAERHASGLYPYTESDPYRINQQLLRHNLLTQKFTVNALTSGAIGGFETERMFIREGDKSGIKHPDVVWITTSGLRIGIEMELSAKWHRDLDQFVYAIAKALQSTEEKPAQFSRFIIVSDSPAIIDRYKKSMQPGATLNIWQKDERKHWIVKKAITVPTWLIEKIDFQLIEK